jgi:CRISPR-associated endonuclease/helicase Cas3
LVPASQRQAPTVPQGGEDGERAPIRRGDVAAFALTAAGDLRKVLRIEDLVLDDDDKQASKRREEDLRRTLFGATLAVDARLRGLSKDGLLDDESAELPRTIDDGGFGLESVRFRVRTEAEQPGDPKIWRERLRFATELSEDGEATRLLIVEKWRHDSDTEEDRSAGRPQLLDKHQSWTEDRARDLAGRLGLRAEYADMLATAARLHDEGKRARRWQQAFNAKSDGFYAKTLGPVNTALLDGYRHEFASLSIAAKDARLAGLPDDLRELALHLIAAHHGFARPIVSTESCEDAPPSVLEERAREVALRFARLQKRWGPWGLAWWESLLRAADQQASRKNDEQDSTDMKERV